jgi:hypothetical protein
MKTILLVNRRHARDAGPIILVVRRGRGHGKESNQGMADRNQVAFSTACRDWPFLVSAYGILVPVN